ncbi:hypothetical protein PPL_12460 [Heterostelium album PN500]|uniref:Uncharacterized protein n=1 Tax=Heterostelium pallidum (strain ATCC 26659 / Pp 5 / PN500) TaxID=670386 RepID=D3BMN7_HETP5|nr:hypothetical protein PPL_12460 [Heterostelium album PN500]EFA77249.1 hypothetical protein PPL_12460 [Heterostelium album PN500]|eukprot:XP_020429378.1 hypothetical protein PPL_12460 [Heterostelium album PN500]
MHKYFISTIFLIIGFCFSFGNGGMLVQSFNGPITNDEIQSFLNHVVSLTPASDNIGNNWAQSGDRSGEVTKSMGIINDLAPAPVGQNTIWTGRIDPCWPNTNTPQTSGSGGEQGDPAGHLGYCARLILQTPAIWNTVIPSPGDPNNLGSTYLLRAKKYISGADYSMSNHTLRSALNIANGGKLYFSQANPYKSGQIVPWNQVMMFLYAFQNLAVAHDILQDNPDLASQYHNLVQVNLNWMFNEGMVKVNNGPKGRPIYRWGYVLPNTNGEDTNHGNLDVSGLYRAYQSGYYGVTSSMLLPVANTYWDIVYRGPADYSGILDGTDGTGNASPTNYVRAGYFSLTEFRPDTFSQLTTDCTLRVGSSSNTATDRVSRMFWLKNQRYQSFSMNVVPTLGAAYTSNYIVSIRPNGAWNSDVSLNVRGLPVGATVTFNGSSNVIAKGSGSLIITVSTSYPTPPGNSTLNIVSSGWGAVSQSSSVTMTALQQIPKPKFSLDGGNYVGKQTLTITSQLSSTIRYTTDSSTPAYNKGIIYSQPIAITKNTTIKAVAYRTNYKDSSTTTEIYYIK